MWYRTYERYDYVPAHGAGTGIGGAIYLGVGVIVAIAYNYFDHLSTLVRVLSAVLAVFLWPLVLLGIHLHI
jgi:hypothetical protein